MYTPLINSPFNRIRLDVLTVTPWLDVSQFLVFISTLSNINFTITAQRDTALETINAYRGIQLISLDPPSRFPASDSYINLFDPTINFLLITLTQALSYRDRALELSRTSTTSSTPAFLNASATYWNTLKDLSALASQVTFYFNRARFEDYYQLEWL